METLTLRDQFAIAAFQGELAAQGEDFSWANEKELAVRAYAIAEAMLAERSKVNTLDSKDSFTGNVNQAVNVDWSQAPSWANFWVQDVQGSYWFDQEPVLKGRIFFGSEYASWNCESAPDFDYELVGNGPCYQKRPEEPSHG